MKIVADENIPYADEAFGCLGEVTRCGGRELTADLVRDAELLFVRSVTKVGPELLEGSRVRFVGTATIGTDHIDLPYLAERGIGFASAPGCNANSVSEYITASLLILSERLGFALADRTIGVIGVGNVGSRVARKCEILGMTVIRNDPPLARETGDPVYRPIEEVFERADIVTCHVPLTKDGPDATLRMVDEAFIARLRPGCIFMNSGRGQSAVDQAIIAALDDGRLAAAALDVWETEPDVNIDLLQRAALASPHVAGYSFDGKVVGTQMIYEAACRFLERPAEWNPAPLLPEPPFKTLELDCAGKSFERALSLAVLKTCDILGDDARMRAAHDCPPVERPANFDRLRKTYPIRREFKNTTLILRSASPELRQTFTDLGYRVAATPE